MGASQSTAGASWSGVCMPHGTEGGPCKPGTRNNPLSASSWWLNVKTEGLLALQKHKSESSVGTVASGVTFGLVGSREHAQGVRFARGDCNVDPFRIILAQPPYTCIASSNDATIDRLEKQFAEYSRELQAPHTGELYRAGLNAEYEAELPPPDELNRRLEAWAISHLLADLPYDVLQELSARMEEIDVLVRSYAVATLRERLSQLTEQIEELAAKDPSAAYNPHSVPNLLCQYLKTKLAWLSRHVEEVVKDLRAQCRYYQEEGEHKLEAAGKDLQIAREQVQVLEAQLKNALQDATKDCRECANLHEKLRAQEDKIREQAAEVARLTREVERGQLSPPASTSAVAQEDASASAAAPPPPPPAGPVPDLFRIKPYKPAPRTPGSQPRVLPAPVNFMDILRQKLKEREAQLNGALGKAAASSASASAAK